MIIAHLGGGVKILWNENWGKKKIKEIYDKVESVSPADVPQKEYEWERQKFAAEVRISFSFSELKRRSLSFQN